MMYLGIFAIFVYSLSAFRQSFAISFCVLALMATENKKYIKTVIFAILGALFHCPVIFGIPIWLLVQKVKSVRFLTLTLLVIITPFIYYFLLQTSILDLLSGYSYNLELYLTIQRSNYTNIIGAIMYMIMGLLWLFFVCEIQLFSFNNGVLRIAGGHQRQ